MKTRPSFLLVLATAAATGGGSLLICQGQTAQSTDYRLVPAATNGGGGLAGSVGYALRPASVEGTTTGISSSTDYTARAGWVSQLATGCPAFDAWRALKLAGNPLNGPGDDPDKDGIPNLMEFALGTEPLSSVSTNPMVVTRAGSNAQVSFQRVSSCLNYSIEISSTLAANDWQPVAAPVTMSITPLAGGMESVQITLPLSPGARKFLRMRATIP